MSNAFSGVGTSFKVGDGASNEQFSAIAEINNISGPNITRDLIDVTSLDSTGGYKEFIAGFRDGGNIDLDMNFTRDGYDDLKAAIDSDEVKNYQVVLGDTTATTFDFAAFCISLSLSTPPTDKVTAKASFKITGTVTLTS